MKYNTSLSLEEQANSLIFEEFTNNLSTNPILTKKILSHITTFLGHKSIEVHLVFALVNQLMRHPDVLKEYGYEKSKG